MAVSGAAVEAAKVVEGISEAPDLFPVGVEKVEDVVESYSREPLCPSFPKVGQIPWRKEAGELKEGSAEWEAGVLAMVR